MASGVELVVIRHLPTEGNRKRQYIGWTDEPIISTEVESVDQERRVVYGSDLLRTRQTAKLLFPNAIYHADARFRECNFGEFEGKTYVQLENNEQYRSWLDNPTTGAPPGGESLRQVEMRVLEAFRELSPCARLVTHGGPIRVLLARFASEHREFWSWNVPHGAVYRFHWDTIEQWKEGQRCTSLSEAQLTENGNSFKK